ncbi:MAG TPA: hypothetical protein PKM59_15070 [Thermodesulfobacteriota bacterium]|nr:hypothetical protein [Thermodesulfobacteriota bacterium]HNU70862.1 hypothetical protein [Thermodesulfobacteriota bacterium]
MADFTSWADVRTAIKNAIANHASGDPCVGSFSCDGVTITYKSYDDLKKLYALTFELEGLDNAGSRQSRTSYGQPRRGKW